MSLFVGKLNAKEIKGMAIIQQNSVLNIKLWSKRIFSV